MEKYRLDEAQGRPTLQTEVINRLPEHFPKIGQRLKEVVTMLLNGETIDNVAKRYDKDDCILCGESFTMIRDIKMEDTLITEAKSKINNPEIENVIKMLVKRINLDDVKEALSSVSQSTKVEPNLHFGSQTNNLDFAPHVSFNFKAEEPDYIEEVSSQIHLMTKPTALQIDWYFNQLNAILSYTSLGKTMDCSTIMKLRS
eukprot:TRINITY_DN1546_c0_g1_i2.p1 TRINITY_DN1546_c0_g1~~TRINITY_DN1546_c0_g1_i2.p1  ORF type:complete len:200 (+),score=40.37 TRINITY_DN1546_c0_g1_i2:185-784(+)